MFEDMFDLNRDGEVDGAELYFAEEMMCSSREEHIALFGDSGEWGDEDEYDEYDEEYDEGGDDEWDF